MGASPALSTQGLVAGYERDLPIVRGIDFAVKPGEPVVVLGPNGAGKSTFVKAIAGVVKGLPLMAYPLVGAVLGYLVKR